MATRDARYGVIINLHPLLHIHSKRTNIHVQNATLAVVLSHCLWTARICSTIPAQGAGNQDDPYAG